MSKNYTNFYSLRLSDEEKEIIEKLSDKWDRSGAQVIRDAIALLRISEGSFQHENKRPTKDAVELSEYIFGKIETATVAPGEKVCDD